MAGAATEQARTRALEPRARDRMAVDLASNGDERSARALVRRLTPLIRARARRAIAREGTGLGSADADDVTQQVWLELFADRGRRLRAYDPTRGVTVGGWVGMVADREIANIVRRAMAQKRGGMAPATVMTDEPACVHADPEEVALARDLAARLLHHLDRSLPASGRLVLAGVFADECTSSEVAARAGLSLQVVYNWQHRIRVEGRAFLGTISKKKSPQME